MVVINKGKNHTSAHICTFQHIMKMTEHKQFSYKQHIYTIYRYRYMMIHDNKKIHRVCVILCHSKIMCTWIHGFLDLGQALRPTLRPIPPDFEATWAGRWTFLRWQFQWLEIQDGVFHRNLFIDVVFFSSFLLVTFNSHSHSGLYGCPTFLLECKAGRLLKKVSRCPRTWVGLGVAETQDRQVD